MQRLGEALRHDLDERPRLDDGADLVGELDRHPDIDLHLDAAFGGKAGAEALERDGQRLLCGGTSASITRRESSSARSAALMISTPSGSSVSRPARRRMNASS